MLAGANAALITSKHDDFKKEPEKESTKEPVQELCNKADQEPANRLQKLSSYHIQHGWEIRCTYGCAWWSSRASFVKSPQNKLRKNPGRVATGKKLAEHTGVAREAKKRKTENIRSSFWAKRERQRRSQRKFASWNRRPGCLRSGRLLSAKGETRLPAKLGHLSLSKSHVANLRSVDWNSFTSYIQPCSKAWLKKLFSGPQRFMTYGAFIIISYS